MDIRFGEHASFHRAAAGMVGGSLLAALALHPITPLAPYVGGFIGIAAGAGFAYGRLPQRMAVGCLAAIPLLLLTTTWPLLAGAAAILALGLALGGPRGMKGIAATAFAAGATLLGMWCAMRIVGARETAHWSGIRQAVVGGAAMGMVGVLAAIPRHLKFVIDPVQAAVKALPASLDSEMRDLCDRAVSIWSTAQERMADDDAGKGLVRDGVMKTLEVATKSAPMKAPAGTADEAAKRMTEMDTRIAAATDDEVKAQYTAARAALEDQRRYRDQIAKGRERLVARMHNHVAALEKFQLAATGIEATRVASAASTTVKQLAELSQDVTASGEALAEIELGVAGASSSAS